MTPQTSNEVIPSQLRGLAEQALSEARRTMEQTQISPVRFLFLEKDGSIKPIALPLPLVQFMNNGRFKDVLFRFVRDYVQRAEPVAVAFLSDTWYGVATEKQKQMAQEDPEQLKQHMFNNNLDGLVELGLCTRAEALMLNLQTAENVFLIRQCYDRTSRGNIVWGARSDEMFPQTCFRGRSKFYGKEEDSELDSTAISE